MLSFHDYRERKLAKFSHVATKEQHLGFIGIGVAVCVCVCVGLIRHSQRLTSLNHTLMGIFIYVLNFIGV